MVYEIHKDASDDLIRLVENLHDNLGIRFGSDNIEVKAQNDQKIKAEIWLGKSSKFDNRGEEDGN